MNHSRSPAALFISYNFYLRVFSHTNTFKWKTKSVHCTKSPKDVRILVLHNSTRGLTCRSVIDYDLDDILSFNLSDAIFKLFHNVIHVFHFSVSIYGVQEHRVTFDDRYKINDMSSLRIHSFITTNGDSFCLHVSWWAPSTCLCEISHVAREWSSKSCNGEVCSRRLDCLRQI